MLVYETISPIDPSSRHALKRHRPVQGSSPVPIHFQPNTRAWSRPFQSDAARNENIIELSPLYPFPPDGLARDCTLLALCAEILHLRAIHRL